MIGDEDEIAAITHANHNAGAHEVVMARMSKEGCRKLLQLKDITTYKGERCAVSESSILKS
jgi:hypothetical protein